MKHKQEFHVTNIQPGGKAVNLSIFLRGFADGFACSYQDADEQWAAYSRQLSDSERSKIESGGYQAGHDEGRRYAVELRGPEGD